MPLWLTQSLNTKQEDFLAFLATMFVIYPIQTIIKNHIMRQKELNFSTGMATFRWLWALEGMIGLYRGATWRIAAEIVMKM